MARRIGSLVLGALLLVACGGGGTGPGGGNGGSAGTGGTGAAAGSGGAGGSAGSATTGGSAGSGGAACPPRSSPACCPGDGMCCDCVSGDVCPDSPFITPDAEVMKFDECACKAEVCGPTCMFACMGMGIDSGCQECVANASKNSCSIEFAACPINNQ